MDVSEPYKYEYHAHGPWTFLKGLGKHVCESCGLVRLNNHITQWSVKMGCDASYHPGFRKQLMLSIELADNKRGNKR